MVVKDKNKTVLKPKRILELLWLVVALLAIGIALKESYQTGLTKTTLMYYLFAAIALFFYFSRRSQRINS